MKGNLYLFPVPIGENDINDTIPPNVVKLMNSIEYFIVENTRTARRYLSKAGIERPIRELTFYELNKHTNPNEIHNYLKPAVNGHHIGLMSEAGCPGVADPGASITKIAHNTGIRVVPQTGPSSILLSLMASGMNGQNFAFVGYLPIKKPERIKRLRELENRSQNEKQTQIFIETPYRNMPLLQDIINTCRPNTRLCIAVDITLDNEFIATKTIADWKNNLPEIHKRTAVFLIYSE